MLMWGGALVAIALAVLVAASVGGRVRAQPPRHTRQESFVSWLVAVIVITTLVAVARIEWGGLPAALVAVVGVAQYTYWATTRGYAGWLLR